MSEVTLKICHLYPDLLNLYGDRGNIICMRNRLQWRGLGAEVTEIPVGTSVDFTQFDLIFIGGGQDFEQEVLLPDLQSGKGNDLISSVYSGKRPSSRVCLACSSLNVFPVGLWSHG